jgi:hypothetical protein
MLAKLRSKLAKFKTVRGLFSSMRCEVVDRQMLSLSFLEREKGRFLANVGVCPSYEPGLYHQFERHRDDKLIGNFLGIRIYTNKLGDRVVYRGETTKEGAQYTVRNVISYAVPVAMAAAALGASLNVKRGIDTQNAFYAYGNVIVATMLFLNAANTFQKRGTAGLYTTEYYTNLLTLLNDLQDAVIFSVEGSLTKKPAKSVLPWARPS